MKPPAAIPVTSALLRKWPLPDPSDSGSKEERGRVLVVGGSLETPGAVRLAGVAALRAGAGKLQIATGSDVAAALAVAVPEARVLRLPVDRRGQIAGSSAEVTRSARRADALLIGPGMDEGAAAQRVAARLMRGGTGMTILDAGALPAFRRRGAGAVILTPHFGEMASLTGMTVSHIERRALSLAREFATSEHVTLVLKGARTHIANPDGRVWIHEGGSVGLGTSGSGDVLAGVIAGLAARGARPEQAAVWGVWLHGKAGTLLSGRLGAIGFLAREIAEEIPALMR
jgi:hydroxyethylthiazole kinase-like uncharacterized protein yjeF